MTSSEIAALTGGFQQQAMGQMHYAAMVSQTAGRQSSGEAIMGSAVNRGAAIGAPLGSAAMGLAGLDPFSMAFKGGMAGFAGGGMTGAAMGAMGGMAMVGAPLMAAQYAGGQMMTGMHQQQQLNENLRQNFNFQGQHGRGFSMGEMGGIGQTIRAMSSMPGPGGELASFEELSRMATEMRRLGMGNNIRSAKDFVEQFKKTMTEVKEVAKAFNTSLEEAQQTMGAMRGAGIFKNQGAVAAQIRGIALSGGLSTAEVTDTMGIGSQISRSIGGLGRAGAMGGMKAIGQVGNALQMGVLSEEDVYNVTGLTGAEGRVAMAQRGMQQSAAFLTSGLGRRFIASMAGQNGQLDAGAVQDYMMGGGNMAGAGGHLGRAGVSRAGFLRNEGRLRGAALEQFGAAAPVMAMMGELQKRGMDVDDDRTRVFMSQRLGMSEEELDTQMKMVRAMPAMAQQQRISDLQDRDQQGIDRVKRGIGVAGIKHKLERFKNEFQNNLQQVGAEIHQWGSEALDSAIARLTGEYLIESRASVEREIQTVLKGGPDAARTLRTTFGIGAGGAKGSIIEAERQRMNRSMGVGGDVQRLVGNEAFNEEAAKVGQAQALKNLQQSRVLSQAFAEGTGQDLKLGDESQKDVQRLVAFGGIKDGKLDDKAIEALATSGSPQLKKIADQARGASSEERARIASSLFKQSGLGAYGKAFYDKEASDVFQVSKFFTKDEREEKIGGYLFKGAGTGTTTTGHMERDDLGRSEWVSGGENVGLSNKVKRAGAQFALSKEGLGLARGVVGTPAEAAEATSAAMIQVSELNGLNRELTDEESGRREYLKSIAVTRDVMDGMSEKALEEKHPGMSAKEIKQRASGVVGLIGEERRENVFQLFKRTREEGAAAQKGFTDVGVMKNGVLSKEAVTDLTKRLGETSASLFVTQARQARVMAKVQEGGSFEVNKAFVEIASELGGEKESIIGKMSRSQRVAAAGEATALGQGELAENLRLSVSAGDIASRMDRAGGVGRGGTVLAGQLGIDLSKDTKAAMSKLGLDPKKRIEDSDKIASMMSSELFKGTSLEGGDAASLYKERLGLALREKGTEREGQLKALITSPEAMKAKQEHQDQDAQKDPSFRMLSKINTSIEAMTKRLDQPIGVKGTVTTVDSKGGDAEGKGPKGGV